MMLNNANPGHCSGLMVLDRLDGRRLASKCIRWAGRQKATAVRPAPSAVAAAVGGRPCPDSTTVAAPPAVSLQYHAPRLSDG